MRAPPSRTHPITLHRHAPAAIASQRASQANDRVHASMAAWPAFLADIDRAVAVRFEGASNVTPSDLLRLWYEICDPLLAHMARLALCKPSCCHCCRIPVSITSIEATLIAETHGAKMHRPSGIKPGATLSAKAIRRLSTACPFLKDQACSIYDVRPFACRAHFSLEDSPDWCDFSDRLLKGVAQYDTSAIVARYASLMMDIESARTGRADALPVLADIREWFPAAARR